MIDEATANIDMRNDAMIQRVIADKFRDSTVITIAHRLSTLEGSDKVMVLEQGKLAQFGSPEELQADEDGFFAEMMHKNKEEILK